VKGVLFFLIYRLDLIGVTIYRDVGLPVGCTIMGLHFPENPNFTWLQSIERMMSIIYLPYKKSDDTARSVI
jgi:hypothetical protein